MKKLTLILLVLATFTACGPKNNVTPKQYSTWIVNGTDTFRTNNVDTNIDCNPDHSYCGADLSSHDDKNRFHIGFYLDYLPVTGEVPLGNFIQQPTNLSDYAFVYFYCNGKGGYIPLHPELDTLYIRSHNGKIYYELKPMWFADNNNLNDSILIQGTFYFP